MESVKQYAIEKVAKTDFSEAIKGMRIIFLKPMQFRSTINWQDIIETTKNDLKSFYEVLFLAPLNARLIVMSLIIIFFGFWDTFVVTFLIDFLNKVIQSNGDNIVLKVIPMSGYIFIAILAIPAFGGQIPLIGLSKKIGTFFVIFFGVLLS